MHYLPFLTAAYGVSFLSLGGMLGWALYRLRRAQRLLEEDR